MPGPVQLAARDARRLALGAQGLAGNRPGRPGRSATRALQEVMSRVGAIQLDAVNVLARSQLIVPFSRIGAYDPAALCALSEPGGPWWEYWGHAASLLPVEHHPLFRHRMARSQADLVDNVPARERRRAWREANRPYLAAVLAEVEARGPLSAGELSDPRRRTGTWWDRRSDGRRALELLFSDGLVAGWRRPSFERVYDLPERVIPERALDAPAPPAEDAERALVEIAAACLGVATVDDLASYFSLRPGVARTRAAELVEAGRLTEATVEGWGRSAYFAPKARAPRLRRAGGTLLSPFDSLIWHRERTERLFGFHYRIEIYVPGARRRHGYYVLPLLLGDALVARLDLKADRTDGTLRVASAHLEPGAGERVTAAAAAEELARLGEWLGLERLEVLDRGDLAPALRAATERRSLRTGCAQPCPPSPG